MKNKFLFPLFAILALAFGAALVSWDRPDATTDSEGTLAAPVTGMYYYAWTKDTLSNANNDTLYLPSRLRPVESDFIMAFAIKRTSISGTANVAVKIEESIYAYSGTTPPTKGWTTSYNNIGAAADTDATTATEETIRIPNAYGRSYRVIIDGTGTQSTSYEAGVLLKKKS